MPVRTRSSKKTTFLDLNDDCITEIMKSCIAPTGSKTTAIGRLPSTTKPVVNVKLPEDIRSLLLAIPSIWGSYHPLVNLYHLHDIRIQSNELLAMSDRTDIVPFASIQYLKLTIDLRDHAAKTFEKAGRIRAQLPQVASFLGLFPVLIEAYLCFEAHPDGFDGYELKALRTHLLFNFIREFVYPQKLALVRVSFSVLVKDYEDGREVLVSHARSLREKRKGMWRINIGEHKDYETAEDLAELAEEWGLTTDLKSVMWKQASMGRN